MNTTLIFAELLIIGLEGGIWLSFIFLSIFGLNAFSWMLNLMKEWQVPAFALVVGLLYVVGVIIDRTADSFFRKAETKVGDEIVSDLPVSIPVMRFSLGTQNDFLNQQLEYTRTRMRIVRASMLNFPMIAISLLIFLFTHRMDIDSNLQLKYIVVIVTAGIIFTYGSYRTWRSLIRAHLKLAREMYIYQTEQIKKQKTPKKS